MIPLFAAFYQETGHYTTPTTALLTPSLINLAVSFINSTLLYPNDTAYKFEGNGNTVVPINNDQIEMINETVKIRFDHRSESWHVDCEFNFRNQGNAAEFLMGFPDNYSDPGYYMDGDNGSKYFVRDNINKDLKEWAIRDFKTIIDGESLETQHVIISTTSNSYGITNGDGAYLWKVFIKDGETKKVQNSYNVGLGGRTIGGGTMQNGFVFKYIVTTGARWKGSIGKAEFFIDLHDVPYSPLFSITPKPQSVAKGIYYLQFENFEPDFDISVEGFVISEGLKNVRGQVGSLLFAVLQTPSVTVFTSKSDLYTISLFKNFLYALYGRSFTTPRLKEYFSKQKWYELNPHYSDSMIPQYERNIIDLIVKEEAKKTH